MANWEITYLLFFLLEWIEVCFKEDNVLYMCPSINQNAKQIGGSTMIKWKDGFKYKEITPYERKWVWQLFDIF